MSEAYFVAGLGYGDEGKGSIIDFLARITGLETIVRYNGGPQASHHVASDNLMHCFSQFGSGTLVPGTKTHLSSKMMVDPLALETEEKVLASKGIPDAYDRLTISLDCLLVTPMHALVGQMLELSRGQHRHGSCGRGVGAAVADYKIWEERALRFRDLLDKDTLRHKLDFIWRVKLDQAEQFVDCDPGNKEIQERYHALARRDYVDLLVREYESFLDRCNAVFSAHTPSIPAIFEGAQGALIDVEYGFWPYVTKTRTTFENAKKLTRNDCSAHTLGVIRAYLTRHGPGPFITEDLALGARIPDKHNTINKWQGEFRIGWLDVLATRYAIKVMGGVDALAVTNLDRLVGLDKILVCTAYEYVGDGDIDTFFDYETIEGKRIIRSILVQRNPKVERQQTLTQHLLQCKPVYHDFKAWADSGLEPSCIKYLDFLASEEGLGVPVQIASFGTEAKDKILLQ